MVTVTAAEKRAKELIALVDAFAARIPELERPHPSTARRVRGARTVTRAFIVKMIQMVDASAELQSVAPFDPARASAVLQFNAEFRHVARHLAALLASLNYTMESLYASVAKDALTTYAIAKGLGRDRRSAALGSYLRNLRRDLGRTVPKSKRRAVQKKDSGAAKGQDQDGQPADVK